MAERSGEDMTVKQLHTFVAICATFIVLVVTAQAVIWGVAINGHIEDLQRDTLTTTTTSVGK